MKKTFYIAIAIIILIIIGGGVWYFTRNKSPAKIDYTSLEKKVDNVVKNRLTLETLTEQLANCNQAYPALAAERDRLNGEVQMLLDEEQKQNDINVRIDLKTSMIDFFTSLIDDFKSKFIIEIDGAITKQIYKTVGRNENELTSIYNQFVEDVDQHLVGMRPYITSTYARLIDTKTAMTDNVDERDNIYIIVPIIQQSLKTVQVILNQLYSDINYHISESPILMMGVISQLEDYIDNTTEQINKIDEAWINYTETSFSDKFKNINDLLATISSSQRYRRF